MLPDKPNYLRARCPSTFSSIAIELLKMTVRFTCHTDRQRTVCSIYLSLLRFSSIAIELKVDGQRALIFKQYLSEFISKEIADVVHEFIDHPSYLTITFQHTVSPQDPSLRARGTCIRRTVCLVYIL